MQKLENIKITVQDNGREMSITLNWDADLEDFKEAFKTILFWKTFTPEQIEYLFNEFGQ